VSGAVLAIELRLVQLPLVRPFRTSFGEDREKSCILVSVQTEGADGWGECVAGARPDYSEEFNDEVWTTIREWIAPALLGDEIAATQVADRLGWIRGHRMAKAAVEMALLDAELRDRGEPLAHFLGATRERVRCGVSVGITPTTEELLEQVDGYVAQGYQRIKLKIEPGRDTERVAAVRSRWPDIPLSVDANAAYSITDAPTLKRLDALDLVMIEQPLGQEDLVEHAKLQRTLATPVCLDESIRSATDAAAAIELGACRVINIKHGRVGGVLEARRIHELARDQDVPVWCGGMLETGVGRAANLALSALPGFTMPGDTSPSARYFDEDLTDGFVMAPDGTMEVPDGPGLGVRPDPDRLEARTRRVELLTA
jgi:o-succinylbenzoate synthase